MKYLVDQWVTLKRPGHPWNEMQFQILEIPPEDDGQFLLKYGQRLVLANEDEIEVLFK